MPVSKYPYSDEQLIALVRQKDDGAATELVTRYLPLVRKRASGYFLPGMEAEDIVQEGLLGLLKAIRLYQPGKSEFAAFASLCISSSMADAARSALSGKSIPLRDYTSLSEEGTILLPAGDPAQQVMAREQLAELERKIRTSLSVFEQQVLRLYLTGRSYAEISRLLLTTPKAVDNALQRVRRKLRSA